MPNSTAGELTFDGAGLEKGAGGGVDTLRPERLRPWPACNLENCVQSRAFRSGMPGAPGTTPGALVDDVHPESMALHLPRHASGAGDGKEQGAPWHCAGVVGKWGGGPVLQRQHGRDRWHCLEHFFRLGGEHRSRRCVCPESRVPSPGGQAGADLLLAIGERLAAGLAQPAGEIAMGNGLESGRGGVIVEIGVGHERRGVVGRDADGLPAVFARMGIG